jgi:hypothetical protein
MPADYSCVKREMLEHVVFFLGHSVLICYFFNKK